MTETLNSDIVNREFSRKSFLKAGGGMVVGFSIAGAGLAGKTGAAVVPSAAGYLPPLDQVDSWLTITADNKVILKTSHIDPGNGVVTGFLMLVAEELDVSVAQVSHIRWDTWSIANSGATGGSNAIQTQAGPRIRAASAYAKQALLGMAATQLGVPASSLSVSDGVVSGGGKSVTYGALVGDKLINAKMTSPTRHPGESPAKPVSQYKLLGTNVPRVDLPDKITGKYTYVHNIKLPGMWHGRVVRPRGQGAYGTGAELVSMDASSIKNIPDVRIIRKGNFVGVVAPQEFAAIQAAAQLKVQWKENPTLPTTGNLWKQMREHDAAGKARAAHMMNIGNVDAAYASAAKKVSGTYAYQYNGRAVIGPACAVATCTPNSATIFTSSQRLQFIHTDIADLLGLSPSQVRVYWYEGASSFGGVGTFTGLPHAPAALMSREIGRPVRVQLMRWDEHGWDQFGPAQLMDVRGGIDANGKIVAFDITALTQPGTSLDTTRELMGEAYPTPGTGGPNASNAAQGYVIPNKRLTGKTLPLYEGYFKVGSLRNPRGPETSFAAEQLIDELAHGAGMDPIAFRRLNITDDRWLGPMNAAVQAANWQPRVAASNLSSANVVKGRGFAFGRHGSAAYAAAVADVEVNKRTGKILVTHIYSALDAGLAVSPSLIENQIVGAAIQGVSRALHEGVRFNKTSVTSLDWVTYPILRFQDTPKVTTAVVQRMEHLPLGTGESPHPPIAPAIANAFFDATGVRIRESPMTPARVRAVLAARGAGTLGVK